VIETIYNISKEKLTNYSRICKILKKQRPI